MNAAQIATPPPARTSGRLSAWAYGFAMGAVSALIVGLIGMSAGSITGQLAELAAVFVAPALALPALIVGVVALVRAVRRRQPAGIAIAAVVVGAAVLAVWTVGLIVVIELIRSLA